MDDNEDEVEDDEVVIISGMVVSGEVEKQDDEVNIDDDGSAVDTVQG